MMEVLSWLLGIAWKLAVLYIGYTALKYVVRNGNRTFREILETIGMAIRVGCLRLRGKLVGQLQPDAAEKEEHIEQNDEPVMQVTGTVR